MVRGSRQQTGRVIDPRPLWDFGDPAGSEQRFRAVMAGAPAADVAVLQTQVARALGLQERYAEALTVLDGVAATDAEVRVRVLLERGRVLRSGGDPDAAAPLFAAAVAAADGAGLDALAVDAMHMVALTLTGPEQVDYTRGILARTRASTDPAARAWTASVLNNLGIAHSDLGEWDEALAVFEDALAERRKGSDAEAADVARWMVAWALRNLGRTDEALAMQRTLKADLLAAGRDDPYVDEELALLEHDPTQDDPTDDPAGDS